MSAVEVVDTDTGEILTLTSAETADLSTAEATIAAGLDTFVEVGSALARIRDGRLYRAEHATFEGYCRARWGMSKRHANRLVEAADVVEQLGPMGPSVTSERQARAVAPVIRDHGPQVAAEVVRRASQRAGDLTAKAITEAAATVTAEQQADAAAQDLYDRVGAKWEADGTADRLREQRPYGGAVMGLRNAVDEVFASAGDFTPEHLAEHVPGYARPALDRIRQGADYLNAFLAALEVHDAA